MQWVFLVSIASKGHQHWLLADCMEHIWLKGGNTEIHAFIYIFYFSGEFFEDIEGLRQYRLRFSIITFSKKSAQ